MGSSILSQAGQASSSPHVCGESFFLFFLPSHPPSSPFGYQTNRGEFFPPSSPASPPTQKHLLEPVPKKPPSPPYSEGGQSQAEAPFIASSVLQEKDPPYLLARGGGRGRGERGKRDRITSSSQGLLRRKEMSPPSIRARYQPKQALISQVGQQKIFFNLADQFGGVGRGRGEESEGGSIAMMSVS